MARQRVVEHTCEVCRRGFSMSGHLTRHMRMHTGERPHKCTAPDCDKSYSRKDNLRMHELSAHAKDKWQYQCDFSGCGRKFPTNNKLKRHRALHEIPTPYHCDLCDKSFRKKRQLATHRTEHTGRLPYPCPEDDCAKEFRTPSALRKHVLAHCWGEESYVCLETACAGKVSFAKFSQLQKHIKLVHPMGPRECEECGRRFRSASGLNKHRQTHQAVAADRKRFYCDFAGCNAAFTSKSNLGSHVRSKHTQQNAFVCVICEHTFSYLVVLQRHMRSIHKVDPAEARRTSHSRHEHVVQPSVDGSSVPQQDLLQNERREHDFEAPEEVTTIVLPMQRVNGEVNREILEELKAISEPSHVTDEICNNKRRQELKPVESQSPKRQRCASLNTVQALHLLEEKDAGENSRDESNEDDHALSELPNNEHAVGMAGPTVSTDAQLIASSSTECERNRPSRRHRGDELRELMQESSVCCN